MIGISAGQRYLTSSPVTARPISIRWISDVPSKIVKIVDYGQFPQVSGLHDPVVSARIQQRLSEGNDGFRSARVRFQAWFGRTPRRHREPSRCPLCCRYIGGKLLR